MIKGLYRDYFQKSKAFLYPALGISRKGRIQPQGVYITMEDHYGVKDMKLICEFAYEDNDSYKSFEHNMLITNPLFHKKLTIQGRHLYIFDLDAYSRDWINFLKGRYSRLSPTLKKAIKVHYGETSEEYKHMDTYLNPENHFELYAELLGVDVSELAQLGELCDPCNLTKEMLTISEEDLKETIDKNL